MTDSKPQRLRIAILWQGLSGYTHAAFTALDALGVDVLVFHSSQAADAPFEQSLISGGLTAHAWHGQPDEGVLEQALGDFDPHALLVSSWHIGPYRRVARRRRGKALRILCMDNQWWGTPKQVLGVLTSPLALRPAYDAAFVPGERSADFARRLGFPDERIIRGIYACDHARFDAVAEARANEPPAGAFVFVGRLVAEKGIDVLAAAYQQYRRTVPEPWPLLVGGAGPEHDRLAGVEGVDLLGFVQPDELPSLLARSGCLVLPSRYEPWGVVVHEATTAGLPVVCTWVCGAASRLVVDGYNGVVVSTGDSSALSQGMARVSSVSVDERLSMTRASRSLARQFTPDRWARHLSRRVTELRDVIGLPTPPLPAAARV